MPAPPAVPDAISSIPEHLIARPMIFPGEDPAVYDNLRAALLQDLSPRSPYERALAENLVRLEWEAFRHGRMRDDLIRTKARDVAVGVFATGRLGSSYGATAAQTQLGFDLFGSDVDKATAASAMLAERRITLGEIFATAYSQVSDQVERHEKKLSEIEMRRRRLREEYDHLRAARAKPVEDAEIIG